MSLKPTHKISYLRELRINLFNLFIGTISNRRVCLFVCLSGRPPKGEVGVPWHLKPGIRPHVQGPGV